MAYSKRVKKYGFIGIGLTVVLMSMIMVNNNPDSNALNGKDKIHFIDVGNSEAVLIESNNKFALIDTGKNDDTDLVEHEKVLEYLKKVASNKDGDINLDFIVATHPQKKAIGGITEIIKNDNVNVSKVVLEDYEKATKRVRLLEKDSNLQSYYELTNLISKENIYRVDDPTNIVYSLGDFKLEFINTLKEKESLQFVEDSNSSIAIKVTKGSKSALITGGLNNLYMDETRVSSDIGNVDLLLLANNGDKTSSTEPFLNSLSPKNCILSGSNENLNPETFSCISNIDSKLYTTKDNGDIVATFTDNDILLSSKSNMSGGWYTNNGERYYYNEKGKFLKGFNDINDHTYFFGEDGAVYKGWFKNNENIYYANSYGMIQKGLIKVNVGDVDRIYNFNENGHMVTGWHNVYGEWYYLNPDINSESYGSALVGSHDFIHNGILKIFTFNESGQLISVVEK